MGGGGAWASPHWGGRDLPSSSLAWGRPRAPAQTRLQTCASIPDHVPSTVPVPQGHASSHPHRESVRNLRGAADSALTPAGPLPCRAAPLPLRALVSSAEREGCPRPASLCGGCAHSDSTLGRRLGDRVTSGVFTGAAERN